MARSYFSSAPAQAQSITVDPVPTNGSSNAVQSDGVFDALASKLDIAPVETGFYEIVPFSLGNVGTTTTMGSANQIRFMRMRFPVKRTFTAIYFATGTNGSTGSLASVGFYSADGNTLIRHTGAQSGTTGSTAIGGTITAWTPEIGTDYLLAWTASDTTLTLVSLLLSTPGGALINAGTTQIGTAANTSTSGVLPATLGALTAASTSPVMVKLVY